jgi:hypothetical protein
VEPDEEETIEMPTARQDFINLSEAEIWQAINEAISGKLDSNPIAVEVARLVIEYMTRFQGHLTQDGYVPAPILQSGVRSPIEKVAVLMVVKYVEAEALEVGAVTIH